MRTTLGLTGPFRYGRGYREPKVGAQPAAGASFTDTIPGDKWKRLVAVTFTLTTSSATANRIVTVDYSQPDQGHFLSDGAAVIQTASSTGVYYGSNERANSEWNTGTAAFFPLWGGFLESGMQVKITVANIDAADQLSGIILTYESFEVGTGGYVVGGTDVGEGDEIVELLPDDRWHNS